MDEQRIVEQRILCSDREQRRTQILQIGVEG
jgi:hypothetical protein